MIGAGNTAKTEITKMSDENILIKRYYSNGHLKYEGHLNEMASELLGKANGTIITPEDYSTRNGSKDGQVSWGYENGQKISKGNYKNGRQDGKWTSWHKNGRIRETGNFKNGLRDGKWTGWYENGQKDYELTWKNETIIGKMTHWHENGQKMSESHYNNDGKPDDKLVGWDENGQITLRMEN